MSWIVLSILTAFSQSLRDVFSKKKLHRIDEYSIAFLMGIFSIIFVFIFLILAKNTSIEKIFPDSASVFFIPQFEELSVSFWEALFINGTLNLIATVVYLKAIKHSELSVTIPMLAFTPVFLIFTSPIILGKSELPNLISLVGILLVVFGSYLLNINERHLGFWKPFRALLKENGPKLMLLVAFIWSITSIYDKVGSRETSSIFWTLSVHFYINIFIGIILIFRRLKKIETFKISHIKEIIPIGLFSSLTSLFQMTAVQLALVANVISIKRTSIVISTIFGYLFFREKNIRSRMLGASIMVLGVIFITLS